MTEIYYDKVDLTYCQLKECQDGAVVVLTPDGEHPYMMFVREFEAIHVEINCQQKGGRYSVENATPTAVAVWAKNKIELHGKATSEDIHA